MNGKENLLERTRKVLEEIEQALKRRDPHLTLRDLAALLVAPTPDHREEAARGLVDHALRTLAQGVAGPGRQATLARAYLAGVRAAWEEHAATERALKEALGEEWHPGFYWVAVLWDGTSFALPEPFPEGELLSPEEVDVVVGSGRPCEETLLSLAEEQAALASLLARAFLAYRRGREVGPEEARALESLKRLFDGSLEDLHLLLFLPSVLTPEEEAREILAAGISLLEGLLPEEEREEWLDALGVFLLQAPPTPDVLRLVGVSREGVRLANFPVTGGP